ncbi:hypothetical protein ACROYT_G039535 [Oculina patagonica]
MDLSAWIASFYILVSIATFNLPIVNCQSFQRSNSRGSFAHFVGNPFTRLTASVLATLQVSSLGECTFECINNHGCFSVNFGDQAEEGKHTCELINTDRFSQPDNFVISQDFHHYNIKTPCMSNPCRNGATCQPIYDKEDYQCICPFGNLNGKNCENLLCNDETLDVCTKAMFSWEVTSTSSQNAVLSNCDTTQIKRGDELLFMLTRGSLADYGKYEIMKVKDVNGCNITLADAFTQIATYSGNYLIAQLFPSYDKVTLSNNCILTCRQQTSGHGGILALRAKHAMNIDGTSKIVTTGKGFRGGQGGDSRGGGGYGGESFLHLATGNNGKGGDISGASWTVNTNGIGGGGAGDSHGSQGGPGGYNAGGGGGDSTFNSDDGAGGGGGGGHFSGGGGGGGGSGCGGDGKDGGRGGAASTVIETYAGGGGVSACTGAAGGNGGQQGQPAQGPCGSSLSGKAGTESRGGEGGDSACGAGYGGGGAGGGMQFGDTDFTKRLSYGGGGGGGGGSAFGDDPNSGGRGGDGSGLVYLRSEELTFDGTIESKGQNGECLSVRSHRSAPGGSGAGGSVVIITKTLHGSPHGKILVQGGVPVKCAFGAGGGGGGGVGRWVVKTEDTLLSSG